MRNSSFAQLVSANVICFVLFQSFSYARLLSLFLFQKRLAKIRPPSIYRARKWTMPVYSKDVSTCFKWTLCKYVLASTRAEEKGKDNADWSVRTVLVRGASKLVVLAIDVARQSDVMYKPSIHEYSFDTACVACPVAIGISDLSSFNGLFLPFIALSRCHEGTLRF